MTFYRNDARDALWSSQGKKHRLKVATAGESTMWKKLCDKRCLCCNGSMSINIFSKHFKTIQDNQVSAWQRLQISARWWVLQLPEIEKNLRQLKDLLKAVEESISGS